jgi:hypothetical protein
MNPEPTRGSGADHAPVPPEAVAPVPWVAVPTRSFRQWQANITLQIREGRPVADILAELAAAGASQEAAVALVRSAIKDLEKGALRLVAGGSVLTVGFVGFALLYLQHLNVAVWLLLGSVSGLVTLAKGLWDWTKLPRL